jgi:hypothetical protein
MLILVPEGSCLETAPEPPRIGTRDETQLPHVPAEYSEGPLNYPRSREHRGYIGHRRRDKTDT